MSGEIRCKHGNIGTHTPNGIWCDCKAAQAQGAAPRAEGPAENPYPHDGFVRDAWEQGFEAGRAASSAPQALDVTPEQLANAMAVEGYADPDWNEQWAAPVEAARRILARLAPSEPTETGETP